MKNLLIRSIRGTLGILPPSFPPKIYNTLIKVPLFKAGIDKIIEASTPETFDMGEGIIAFNKKDPVMAGWVTLGSYEPETVKLFRETLKGGMNVVDIGANIGYYTIIAARRVGASGKVYAYEPDPSNAKFLQNNVSRNSFINVVTSTEAISNESGSRELFFGDNECTHSFSDNRKTGKGEMVMTNTLDASLRSHGSPKIDVVKMDIEGAEVLALEGMSATVAANPKLVIFTEIYPRALKRLGREPIELLNKLDQLGFNIFVIEEDKGAMKPIGDFAQFLANFPDDESVRNLYATRKN